MKKIFCLFLVSSIGTAAIAGTCTKSSGGNTVTVTDANKTDSECCAAATKALKAIQ